MNQRFCNMLDAMIRDLRGNAISGYNEFEENTFELTTFLTDNNHRTFIRFMPTSNGEKLRVLLTHIWGMLDFEVDVTEGINQMLNLLTINCEKYQTMFYGVLPIEENYYLTLNSHHYFLMKWSDEDIGKVLSLAFFDFMTLKFPDDSFTMVRVFA